MWWNIFKKEFYMSCEKCKKVTKQQQQIVDHSKAVKDNNEKLQKEYVQLHAQVGHYQKELESIKKKATEKVESVIRLYDKHNQMVLDHLKQNGFSDHALNQVQRLMPIKL